MVKNKQISGIIKQYAQGLPTIEMFRLFHDRFWLEQGYQQLKEELGLDHH